MKKISFSDIFKESWHLSFARAGFFLFGFFLALPVALQIILMPASVQIEQSGETLLQHPFLMLLLFLCSFIFRIFGKGNLITALHAFTKAPKNKHPFSLKSAIKILRKALALDLTIALFFLLILSILSAPTLFSFIFFRTIPESILFLSALVFLPIVIIAFFIREFSFFYFLLSPLRLRASLEASSMLFSQKKVPCLLFGLFTLILSILFTFLLNPVMLGIVALSQKASSDIPETAVVFAGSLLYLTWYEVFQQALWLTFFKRIATSKTDLPEESTEALFKEKVSEIPSA